MEFTTVPNVYGDLQILGPLPSDPLHFRTAIDTLFANRNCTRGVWLELPIKNFYHLFPIAIEKGFQVHHSYRGVLTLQAWRKYDPITGNLCPNPTPPYPTVGIGAGAIVINKQGYVLGINEKYDTSNFLFPPGGHVDEGENWVSAAVREAYEETGVICEPLGIIDIRQLQIPRYQSQQSKKTNSAAQKENDTPNNLSTDGPSSHPQPDFWIFDTLPPWELPLNASSSSSSSNSSSDNHEYARTIQSFRFGTSHLGVHVLCIAVDDTLTPDKDEISDAQWYPPEIFIERAHAHIACMVAAALESGQIAEAAKYAQYRHKELNDNNTSASSSSSANSSSVYPSSLNYIHTTHAWLGSTRRGAIENNNGGTPKPLLTPTLHTFYHGYSPLLFERVNRALPRTVNIKHGTLFGTRISVVPDHHPESGKISTPTTTTLSTSTRIPSTIFSNKTSSSSGKKWLWFSTGIITGIGIALIFVPSLRRTSTM
jgi:8-oxo-dGTP pyrophosphatase MutT (NUDIX family)